MLYVSFVWDLSVLLPAVLNWGRYYQTGRVSGTGI